MNEQDLTTDDALRRLFADYRPQLSDSDAFTRRLTARLEAAAYIQAYQRRQKSLLRSVLLFTLILGIATGACITALYERISEALSHTCALQIAGMDMATVQITLITLSGGIFVMAAAAIFLSILRYSRPPVAHTLSRAK